MQRSYHLNCPGLGAVGVLERALADPVRCRIRAGARPSGGCAAIERRAPAACADPAAIAAIDSYLAESVSILSIALDLTDERSRVD